MIALAHNAALHQVPYDFGRLIEEPQGSMYVSALSTVVDMVAESRERAAKA